MAKFSSYTPLTAKPLVHLYAVLGPPDGWHRWASLFSRCRQLQENSEHSSTLRCKCVSRPFQPSFCHTKGGCEKRCSLLSNITGRQEYIFHSFHIPMAAKIQPACTRWRSECVPMDLSVYLCSVQKQSYPKY